MNIDIPTMIANTRISGTGYWESNTKLYHVVCEPLCNWIINYLKNYKDIPLYDFGCGNGHYLKHFNDNGFNKLTGFEGKFPKYPEFNNIIEQDLTKPFNVSEPGNCVFLEVAEHIPAQYEDIMLKNISNACSNKLIMSWAVRGQGGQGHVNCLDNEEVIDKMLDYGFKYLKRDTTIARKSIPDDNPYIWFKTTTMIFKKQG